MKNFKDILKRFPLKVSRLLWAALAVVILLDIFALRHSLGAVLAALKAAEPAVKRLVRVDFKTYDEIAAKIEAVKNYRPSPPASPSPFGLNEKAQQ